MNFKEFQTEQKLRGGYYTPPDLAEFLVRWVNHKSPKKILEPSCGDGVFLGSIARHIKAADVTGFEVNTTEAKKAHKAAVNAGLKNCQINDEDFLGWALGALKSERTCFDAVLGNPPFIRYQYLPELFQDRAEEIFNQLDCKFTKHTNAWVPFILASFAMLNPGGRLAMVVPAEIIHVTHAQSLRTYLGKHASRLVVIDPEELWFSDTLQGAVILLAEKKTDNSSYTEGLGIYPVRGREFLRLDPEDVFRKPQSINGKTVEGKWTRALLDKSALSLLDGIVSEKLAYRFDDVADVDVGIVTGANNFFLVQDEVVEQYGLHKWAHPMFGRSEHCPGIVYDEKQHKANADKGNPTNFIWFKDNGVEKTKKGKLYIEMGEKESLHTRYKCRIRSPWYSVPSVYSTEVGMLKRSHDTPRLILNKIGAYTTDTAYRIRVKQGSAQKLVYSFVNALTSLSAELEGRHYGGGVLELVPSEIEKLLIPRFDTVKPKLAELDKFVRTMSADEVLEKQTAVILGASGVSKKDQSELLSSWKKLRDRRHRISSEEAA